MKMRMTVVFEYQTGADDTEIQNAYGTLDPEECAQVDREAVTALGGVVDFIHEVMEEHEVTSWSIEPVPE